MWVLAVVVWTSVVTADRAGVAGGVCVIRGLRGHSLLIVPALLIDPANFFHSFLFLAMLFI